MYTILFVLIHLLLAGSSDERPAKENRFVKVDVTLASTAVLPGGKGTILVSFTPIDGIHINIDPPVTVKIEKNRFIGLEGELDVSTDKESGFLSTSTPVEQRFHVFRNARLGEQTVKGIVVYYFCSDTEGWCRKLSQPIMLKLNIQKN